MIDWDTIATAPTTSTTSSDFDFKKMLTLMDEIKAKGRFLDAVRDVSFEDIRARGSYIKAERDVCGEYWVVDDAIFERLKQLPKQLQPTVDPFAFYGVRIVPLSQWISQHGPKEIDL